MIFILDLVLVQYLVSYWIYIRSCLPQAENNKQTKSDEVSDI